MGGPKRQGGSEMGPRNPPSPRRSGGRDGGGQAARMAGDSFGAVNPFAAGRRITNPRYSRLPVGATEGCGPAVRGIAGWQPAGDFNRCPAGLGGAVRRRSATQRLAGFSFPWAEAARLPSPSRSATNSQPPTRNIGEHLRSRIVILCDCSNPPAT